MICEYWSLGDCCLGCNTDNRTELLSDMQDMSEKTISSYNLRKHHYDYKNNYNNYYYYKNSFLIKKLKYTVFCMYVRAYHIIELK